MSESEADTRGPERPNKPALPPFRGPGAAVGPVLRPATDLRGRKTLPPFFARPVRVGGPLPGATPRRPVRETVAPAPEPVATVVAPAQPEIHPVTATRERPAPAPAPSWDTPAMPVAAAIAVIPEPVSTVAGIPSVPTVEAEWAPPMSDPHSRRAVEPEPPRPADPASVAEVIPATDVRDGQDAADLKLATTTATETVTHDTVAHEPAAPTAPGLPEANSEQSADAPHAADEETESQAPTERPTLFEDAPLSALPSTVDQPRASTPYVNLDVRSEDITDMFAEPYKSAPATQPLAPAATPAPMAPRRPARKTPPLGAARPGQAGTHNMRGQSAARIGRRVTPVLSQAITPMSVATIRQTPMAPSTALERAPVPPPASVHAGGLSPTPIAVPVLEDIVASRAVAHALETVAARVRAGQVVIAGQVPLGDDVESLAAALAAALAALLGVQR